VLKRLRASRASALGVVAGTLAPLGLLLLVQAVVLFAVVAVVGGQTPARVALLALAATLGAVAACALAVVTAAVTPAPELAQLTTAPIGLAFFGGGPWAMQRPLDDVGWAMLAAPGVPVAQLTRLGWDEVATATVLRVGAPSVVALLALAVLSTALAVRVFRWDPRA
jgi:ABC-2 type transport system permease protein